MTRKSKKVRTYHPQFNSGYWWAYNNRGMALEDLATFNGTQKDCGKVIDFTPPVTFNFAPDPTKSARIKSKTNQITEAFSDMTAQFKNTFFRTR